MSILEEKIKSLIDELDYSDEKEVDTDRESIVFIMNEIVQYVLSNLSDEERNKVFKILNI